MTLSMDFGMLNFYTCSLARSINDSVENEMGAGLGLIE